MPSKNSFQDHMRLLRHAAKAHGVEVLVDLDSMRAFLRHTAGFWVLQPQFVAEIDGRTRYIPTFTDAATHLAGWTPRPNPGWPATKDKLLFKREALQRGLRVPEFSLSDADPMDDVVVKRAAGSFGEHVSGPYRSSRERVLNGADGEYFERFIDGELLKIWYWEGAPVCLERDAMPSVRGNGRSSLRKLIHTRANSGRRLSVEKLDKIAQRCAEVLRYDGRELDHIPPSGERQRVEFRYGSDLMGRADRTVVDLRDDDPQWAELRTAGPRLLELVPESLRQHTLFTIDAVRDAHGLVWLLEMNANPTVHPLVYDDMIASLVRTQASSSHSAEPATTSGTA